jgi:hypothetical protein
MRNAVVLAGKRVEYGGPLRGPLRIELQVPERDLQSRELVGRNDFRWDGAIPLQITLRFGLKCWIIPNDPLGRALAVFPQEDWLDSVIVADKFIQIAVLCIK